MVLVMSFSIDSIAKLLSLSCESVGRNYASISLILKNFFLIMRPLQALLSKSPKRLKHYEMLLIDCLLPSIQTEHEA